jgi:hypothetical protein
MVFIKQITLEQYGHRVPYYPEHREFRPLKHFHLSWDSPIHGDLECLSMVKMVFPDMPVLLDSTPEDPLYEEDLRDIALLLREHKQDIYFIKRFVESSDPMQGFTAERCRTGILTDYADSVFSGKTTGYHPKRVIFGEAEIVLQPGTIPGRQRAYPLTGEKDRHGSSSLTNY